MSWIKVRRDNVELLVSHESYRDVFSKQGYEVVKDPSPTHMQFDEKKPEKTVKTEKPVEKKTEATQKGGQLDVHKGTKQRDIGNKG